MPFKDGSQYCPNDNCLALVHRTNITECQFCGFVCCVNCLKRHEAGCRKNPTNKEIPIDSEVFEQ